MESFKLEGSLLKKIAVANSTAEVVTTSLALRQRLRHFSDIRRTKVDLIKSGEKIVDNDYMKFWKDLQDLGVGSIVYGRKGNPDRFEWHYDLKRIATAALEGKDLSIDRIGKLRVINKVEEPPKKVLNQEERIVCILIRDGLQLNLKLPAGINKKDLEFASEALKKIAI